jgi:hypothetical protein
MSQDGLLLLSKPYRFWNLSILPAVSTNFCFPVKKGWQAEQSSSLISGLVERVSNSFPQAQVTRTLWYFGWIPSFISASLIRRIPEFSGANLNSQADSCRSSAKQKL